MKNLDQLYDIFNAANESRKRENFNAFMNGFEAGVIKDLDSAFASDDLDRYNTLLNNVKAQGFRVFRDSKGRHKIEFV